MRVVTFDADTLMLGKAPEAEVEVGGTIVTPRAGTTDDEGSVAEPAEEGNPP